MDKEKVIKKIKQGAPATSAIVVAACIGVSLSGYQAPVYEAQAQTKETKTTDAEEAKKTESKAKGSFDLADGIYKGTGTGYAGEVTVAVTIKDKQITAIDILSSSDDAAFFNRAKAVIDRIIVGQTLDVDVVSGATFSSNGIISAVKNALTGEKDSGETGESQSGNAAVQGSTAHYASMMGKTIDSIEYYTTNGLYTIDVNDLYVPVKFAKTEDAVKVADADISAGKTAIELNLRDDFDPEYTVEGLNVKVEGNVLTFKADSSINPGKYTLTVKDKNGKYADLKTTFILSTTDMPATYDADNKKLTVAENSNEEAFNTYIGNITSVNVNGTDYAASGRGSVKIIDKDGTLVTDAAPFKDAAVGTEFQITVTSTGYTTPLTFTYKVPGETPAPSEVDTTKLAAAIEKAEGLNESDYTKDSWKALQSELTKAKSALEAKESQDTVDKAADSLNKAIDALEAATPDEPTKEVSTDALEKAIKAAGALKESDYTADSWKALQSALAEADTALKEKKNQDTVDKATEKLNKAISALVKKDAGQKVNGTNGTTGTSGKSGKTGSTLNTKSGKAAKTGDPSSMFAWLGLAVTSLGAGIGGFSLKRKKREDEE